MPPDFDRIARPYRFLEYLTLGSLLKRCRNRHLPQLLNQRRALVLGDGDGRFLSALLQCNPLLQADAVDASPAMLRLLEDRCASAKPRLRIFHSDAVAFVPDRTYDLVVTHFFLDCLTQDELETLIDRVVPALSPRALWLVSDFRIPEGPIKLPARVLIRGLYLAFRVLTGLRVTHLPDYESPLVEAGFDRVAQRRSFAAILSTELWQLRPDTSTDSPF